MCSYEIGAYEKLAERRDLPLRFHDSMRVAQPLAAYGLRREHLERRLYLRDEQGRIVERISAPCSRSGRVCPDTVAWPAYFPGRRCARFAKRFYDHCIAPGLAYWARVRQSGVRHMSELSALTTVIVISLVLSSGTVFAIYRRCTNCSRRSARSASRRNSGRAPR